MIKSSKDGKFVTADDDAVIGDDVDFIALATRPCLAGSNSRTAAAGPTHGFAL